MTGYNSSMHRKVVRLKKYSAKQRSEMKRTDIAERQKLKDAIEKVNPFRGLLSFLQTVKNRNKENMSNENIGPEVKRGHQKKK